jgi:hypothetical protein
VVAKVGRQAVLELEEGLRSLGALAILEERLRRGGLPGGHGGDAVASPRGGKGTDTGAGQRF